MSDKYVLYGLCMVLMAVFLVACNSSPTTHQHTSTKKSQPEEIKPPEDSLPKKLIVVSSGNGLNQYGRTIQKTLFGFLEPHLNGSLPFMVLRLEPSGVTNPFSNWGQFKDEKELLSTIRTTMPFGYSFNALKSLEYIEKDAASGQYNRVLYLTDNALIPSDLAEIGPTDVPKFLPSLQLTVLTTGSCDVWTQKAKAQQCQHLDKRADIENGLRDFLNQ